MKKIYEIPVLLVLSFLTLTSCSYNQARMKQERILSALEVGSSIHDVRLRLIDEGLIPSRIDYSESERLTMIVTFRELTKLDGLSYAMGTDLKPWAKNEKRYLLISSDRTGVINKIEIK